MAFVPQPGLTRIGRSRIPVRRPMITQLMSVFQLYENEDEAVSSFANQRIPRTAADTGYVEKFSVLGSAPAAYQKHLVPVLFQPLAEATLSWVTPGPGQRVLDVACGTGVVSRLAAATGARVVGLDHNPAMLSVAREVEPAVEWVPGDAASMPFADDSFDIAFCQQGMQFMPDPAKVLREIRRVLVPGGQIAVALWRGRSRTPGFAALVDVLDRHAGPAAGDVLRGPFALPDAGVLRELVTNAGFSAARMRIHLFAVRFASIQEFFDDEVAATPLAQSIPDLPEATRRAMVRDLTEALADYTDDDGVVFPIESHIVRAEA